MRPSSKGNNTKLSHFLKCQLWGRIDLRTLIKSMVYVGFITKENKIEKKHQAMNRKKKERVWFNVLIKSVCTKTQKKVQWVLGPNKN